MRAFLFLIIGFISSCSLASSKDDAASICSSLSALNDERAFFACKVAAESGDDVANLELGLIYSYGNKNIEPNESLARHYLTNALKAGVNRASLELAYLNEESESHILKILHNLSADGDGSASFKLYKYHMKSKEFSDAVHYLSLASEQNDLDAMYKYALVLLGHNAAHIGLREVQNESKDKAMTLLRDSAGRGYQPSIYVLLKLYKEEGKLLEGAFWSEVYFLISGEHFAESKEINKGWSEVKLFVSERFAKYPKLLSYISFDNINDTVILRKYFQRK